MLLPVRTSGVALSMSNLGGDWIERKIIALENDFLEIKAFSNPARDVICHAPTPYRCSISQDIKVQ